MTVCKTTDGGATWGTGRKISSGDGVCADLAVAPANSQIIYAVGYEADKGRIYRSDNGGDTWSRRPDFPLAWNIAQCKTVVVDPSDASHLFIGTDKGVCTSSDGGQTWTASNLTVDVNDLVRDADGILYAATGENGIYRSEDEGATWSAFNFGLERKMCLCLEIDPVGQYLFVGTSGGGVWRMDLSKNRAGAVWTNYR